MDKHTYILPIYQGKWWKEKEQMQKLPTKIGKVGIWEDGVSIIGLISWPNMLGLKFKLARTGNKRCGLENTEKRGEVKYMVLGHRVGKLSDTSKNM